MNPPDTPPLTIASIDYIESDACMFDVTYSDGSVVRYTTEEDFERIRAELVDQDRNAIPAINVIIDDDDEHNLLVVVYVNKDGSGRQIYIPGDPDFPKPPSRASK